MTDASLAPETRTLAAIGAIGAEYWLGRTREALAHADALAEVAATDAAKQALPYGAAFARTVRDFVARRRGRSRPGRRASNRNAADGGGDARSVRRDRVRSTASGGSRWRVVRPTPRCGGSGDASPRSGRSTNSSRAISTRCWPALRRRAAISRWRLRRLQAGADLAADEDVRGGVGVGRSGRACRFVADGPSGRAGGLGGRRRGRQPAVEHRRHRLSRRRALRRGSIDPAADAPGGRERRRHVGLVLRRPRGRVGWRATHWRSTKWRGASTVSACCCSQPKLRPKPRWVTPRPAMCARLGRVVRGRRVCVLVAKAVRRGWSACRVRFR